MKVGLVLMLFTILLQTPTTLTNWKSSWLAKMVRNSLASGIGSRWSFSKRNMLHLIFQVGPPPGFQLTLGPFRPQNCSYLPDRLSGCPENTDHYRAGNMMFSTKWVAHFHLILTNNRDHGGDRAVWDGGYGVPGAQCANYYRGGWWFNNCGHCVTCPEITYAIEPLRIYGQCSTEWWQEPRGGEYNHYKVVAWAKAEFLLVPSKSPPVWV